jgi:hypothetical protein
MLFQPFRYRDPTIGQNVGGRGDEPWGYVRRVGGKFGKASMHHEVCDPFRVLVATEEPGYEVIKRKEAPKHPTVLELLDLDGGRALRDSDLAAVIMNMPESQMECRRGAPVLGALEDRLRRVRAMRYPRRGRAFSNRLRGTAFGVANRSHCRVLPREKLTRHASCAGFPAGSLKNASFVPFW